MPDAPAEILKSFATRLEQRASYLMDNRSSLGLSELTAEKASLKNRRVEISKYLNGKQLQRFNQNMDEVEDILDGLIRRIKTNRDAGRDFTSEVRNLAKYLRAASSLIWAFPALLISILPSQ
jgi:hypothetical protein